MYVITHLNGSLAEIFKAIADSPLPLRDPRRPAGCKVEDVPAAGEANGDLSLHVGQQRFPCFWVGCGVTPLKSIALSPAADFHAVLVETLFANKHAVEPETSRTVFYAKISWQGALTELIAATVLPSVPVDGSGWTQQRSAILGMRIGGVSH